MLPLLLDAIATKPDSGRLMARELGSGNEALVGVLHFPSDFKPKEGALYLAIYAADGSFHVVPSIISDDFPEEYGGGMEGVLKGDCWRKTNMPGTLTVRFVEAFPETNGWTLYGASNQMLFPPSAYHRGHAFMEVSNGRVQSLPAVDGVNGMSVSQLLTNFPVWPDAKGVMHVMPATEARWRKTFLDYSMLQASFGAGEITEKAFIDAVRADPKIFHIRSLTRDEQYFKYLAALRDAGGIELQRPLTIPEKEAREALSSTILREMVAEQRMSEMKNLATTLKL